MNPSLAFIMRNSLDSVATGLVGETWDRFRSLDRHLCVGDVKGILSALAVQPLSVGRGQLLHEELGIITALAWADFDNCHFRLRWLDVSSTIFSLHVHQRDGKLLVSHVYRAMPRLRSRYIAPTLVRPDAQVIERNTTFKPETYYALRFVGTNVWLDPRTLRKTSNNGKEMIHVPSSSSEPILNKSEVLVDLTWRTYEADRRHREIVHQTMHLRELEVVVFKTGFIDKDVPKREVDPMEIRALHVGYHYGAECQTAFRMLVAQGLADEYRYVLRRRGGKALMDELMSDNFSYGTLTFVRDETELCQARLILGDGRPAIYFDLVEFPVTE